jgi:AcrR family transcriptional regulator
MQTPSNSRKQQGIKARDGLILSAANNLFAQQGYHATTMQNIADTIGYSKGTIYQHYTSKENVLAKLFIQCGETLLINIKKVIDAELDSRQSILLITGIFLKHTREQPGVAGNVPLVQSPCFIAKLASDLQQQIETSEQAILALVFGLFSDCHGFDHNRVKAATFGWWSMQSGVQNLMISGWDISVMGFKSPEEHAIESINFYIDGLSIDSQQTHLSWSDVKLKMQNILDLSTF